MKAFHTHICLINQHPLDNILPLLDPAIAPKEVILCSSPSLMNDAEKLMQYIKQRNINVQIVKLPEKHDLPSLQLAFMERRKS